MKGLLFFLILLSLPCSAQRATVEGIVQKVIANVSDDSMKVVRIFDWITTHIKYDRMFEARRGNGDTTLWQEPYNVVVTKMAVCIGFAKLFREMCRQAGIEAYLVEGMTKNVLGYFSSEGHAWNTVRIHQNWYLVDATWSGGLRQYFLMSPSVFHENHLPDDPMWQLSENPISYNCFAENKNCSSTATAVFNYRDTIAHWQKLDTSARLLNESMRSFAFNPNNLSAIRGMAQYYGERAFQFVSTYMAIRKEVVEKKRQPIGRDSILALIEQARVSLAESHRFYDRLADFAKKGRYTDAHLNMELIQENLANLEKEKAFVLKYFRD